MFAHAAHDGRGSIVFYHILFNMFSLWMFGRILENVWGAKPILIFLPGQWNWSCPLPPFGSTFTIRSQCRTQLNAAIPNNDQEAYDFYSAKAGFLASAVGASGDHGFVRGLWLFISKYSTDLLIYSLSHKGEMDGPDHRGN